MLVIPPSATTSADHGPFLTMALVVDPSRTTPRDPMKPRVPRTTS
jgi:hypothetical protein